MSSLDSPSIFFRQPFKGLYILQRLLTALFTAPFLLVFYVLFPHLRPRKTWTAVQSTVVKFLGRNMALVNDVALVVERTDKDKLVPDYKLKETNCIWIDPPPPDMIRGIALDEAIKPIKIPGYIWPKNVPLGSVGDFVTLWVLGLHSFFMPYLTWILRFMAAHTVSVMVAKTSLISPDG
jgi:hypothetical protein